MIPLRQTKKSAKVEITYSTFSQPKIQFQHVHTHTRTYLYQNGPTNVRFGFAPLETSFGLVTFKKVNDAYNGTGGVIQFFVCVDPGTIATC